MVLGVVSLVFVSIRLLQKTISESLFEREIDGRSRRVELEGCRCTSQGPGRGRRGSLSRIAVVALVVQRAPQCICGQLVIILLESDDAVLGILLLRLLLLSVTRGTADAARSLDVECLANLARLSWGLLLN